MATGNRNWGPSNWQVLPGDLQLNTERGTVLFADLLYDDPAGQRHGITVNVIDSNIGSITMTTFFDMDDLRLTFAAVDPALDGATLIEASLRIVYPDGQFKVTVPHAFNGDLSLIGWTQGKFDAGFIPTLPDWDNNPAYLTIRPHDRTAA